MLTRYFEAAMARADYEEMPNGKWYARIPGFVGLWAQGATREESCAELRSALEDWVLYSLQRRHLVPVVGDLDLNVKSVA